jgi:hypothetical protein
MIEAPLLQGQGQDNARVEMSLRRVRRVCHRLSRCLDSPVNPCRRSITGVGVGETDKNIRHIRPEQHIDRAIEATCPPRAFLKS